MPIVRTTLAVLLALGLAAAPAAAQTGGASSSPVPRVATVTCSVKCAGVKYAREGSTLVLRGRYLDAAELVTFVGGKAAGDEVSVEPLRVGPKKLTVVVPRRALSGRVTVTDADGNVSAPSRTGITIEDVATHRVTSGPGPAIDMAVSGRKVFLDGERLPTLTYVLHDTQPVHAAVEVVRVADGVSVVAWDQGVVPAGEERSVSWDGATPEGPAAEGRYEFRITAVNDAGVRASSAQAGPPPPSAPPSPDSFMLLGHKFPIRGAHQFGTGAAAFGGGRGHEGQDVFAKCGTPLVAARGGVVKMKRFQSRAGNYVVIDGGDADYDYMYAHLRVPAVVEQGERVRTGQLIGEVGDTGRADGCHLHLELWSQPGWYTGGSPFDPLALLKAWDRFS